MSRPPTERAATGIATFGRCGRSILPGPTDGSAASDRHCNSEQQWRGLSTARQDRARRRQSDEIPHPTVAGASRVLLVAGWATMC